MEAVTVLISKEPIAFAAMLTAIIALLWQFITHVRTSKFNKRVYQTEKLIASQSVINDLYESQIKPLICGIIKHTPAAAKLTPQSYSQAERVYGYMFHLYKIMQDIESIDKEKAERLRQFIANSILWSCHFLEAVYVQAQDDKFKDNLIGTYCDCREKEISEYFSKRLPETANISTNYDLELFN